MILILDQWLPMTGMWPREINETLLKIQMFEYEARSSYDVYPHLLLRSRAKTESTNINLSVPSHPLTPNTINENGRGKDRERPQWSQAQSLSIR